jgi:hypothetical protein
VSIFAGGDSRIVVHVAMLSRQNRVMSAESLVRLGGRISDHRPEKTAARENTAFDSPTLKTLTRRY